MTVDEKIKRIKVIMNTIEPDKIIILTGSNGSGKSLVRKQICFNLSRKIGNVDYKRLTADVSMQRRTESNPYLGALGDFMHDVSWLPTSISTYDFIEQLIKTFVKQDVSKRYLIIDEPEIGMSKESQLGLAMYFKKRLPEIVDHTYGILIITHSEIIVDVLKSDAIFLNMDVDCTADEWLNREIIPTDFEKLADDSHELFQAIQNYSKNDSN